MALSRDKKTQTVDDITKLLSQSKLTVLARYSGTSVKSMQLLRNQAKENGTQIRVAKNRLVKRAMQGSDTFKQTPAELLQGQLMYAFSSSDEAAPARVLANFAKNEPQIEFIGAIREDGSLMEIDDLKLLAFLPAMDELRARLVGTIAAPIGNFAHVLSANVGGLLNVLNSRASQVQTNE